MSEVPYLDWDSMAKFRRKDQYLGITIPVVLSDDVPVVRVNCALIRSRLHTDCTLLVDTVSGKIWFEGVQICITNVFRKGRAWGLEVIGLEVQQQGNRLVFITGHYTGTKRPAAVIDRFFKELDKTMARYFSAPPLLPPDSPEPGPDDNPNPYRSPQAPPD